MMKLIGIVVALLLVTLVYGDQRQARKDIGFEFYPGVGYYAFGQPNGNWSEALRNCRRRGAKLVVINSEEERAAVMDFLTHYTNSQYLWSGFTNVNDYYKFVTADGLPLETTGYTNWKAQSPSGNQLRCGVVINYSGELTDLRCDMVIPFICELGLWNDYEYLPGLGYYKLYLEGKYWVDAYNTCKQDGAHLLVIDSQEEADAVMQLYNQHPNLPNSDTSDNVYIGFRNVPDVLQLDPYNQTYLTIFGNSVSNGYSKWSGDEPQPGKASFCGTLERDTAAYKMWVCDRPLAFFCEKELEDFNR